MAAVGGLIAGGLIAAPFAGFMIKLIPIRALTWGVGVLVILLAGYQTARLAGLV